MARIVKPPAPLDLSPGERSVFLAGSIEMGQDGRYLLTGEAAPGPGAGPAIFDTLSFLGSPDSQGRRPFTIEGSL